MADVTHTPQTTDVPLPETATTPASQAETVAASPSKRARYLKWARAGILVTAFIAFNAGISLWLVQAHSPTVVAFNMKGTLDAFMDQTAKASLNEAQGAALASRFNTAMTESLAAYQADHQALILVQPAVVGGAQDITAEIQHDIARRMRGAQ
ncbi:type-F conjugative transfer system protein TrbI [Chimaeribacter arupi]|uniref:type-F conjugative transfer system protein TrbI n=1 Tax=Chimaeribacter arupi TaxID=2060066 RepID=UPI000C7B5BB4|nr:type-F conjugative transfer system protein TrbI [Chimaeribacter arupi]PLR30056.1 type-F conjugative transfer system protein TrbI [Chimaeribacter arupi]